MYPTPIPYEQEYPEEAKILMQLCQNKKFRLTVQDIEAGMPQEDRFYQYVNHLKTYLNNLIHGGGDKNPYVRSSKKIGRNDPCPCGSNKKYKKCCML